MRFQPLSAFETPDGMERLCATLRDARSRGIYDELLLIPVFILDFLCIHPFSDGNGRMSRLLTLLLMYQAGYIVGKYISMEMVIEKSKETHYEALRASSQGWLEGRNDPVPFVRYFLGTVLNCYRTFEERVEDVLHAAISKPDRIRNMIDRTLGKFRKADLIERCPDISETTIERTLKQFLDEGYIQKLGGGRGAGYAKVMAEAAIDESPLRVRGILAKRDHARIPVLAKTGIRRAPTNQCSTIDSPVAASLDGGNPPSLICPTPASHFFKKMKS